MQAKIENEETRSDPAAKKPERRKAVTFAELATRCVELHGRPNKGPRALADDPGMFERHILPEIAGMKARDRQARRD